MTVYAVMVGRKYWCKYEEDDRSWQIIAAPEQGSKYAVLTFPDWASAWRFASKKMDDVTGHKFRVVEIEQPQVAGIIEVDVPRETAKKPKRKKKRAKRNVRLAVTHG